MNLAYILKDSNYKLSQFNSTEIEQLEQSIILKSTKTGETPYTVCLVRKKDVKLTPEEAIRQLYLRVLTGRFHYPIDRIQVEYGVNFGREVKRADIVIMDKDRRDAVYILVELKKPKLKDGKEQLRSYCNATGAPIGIWTNGDQITHYQRKDPNFFELIPEIPAANQTLADVLQKSFTLDDLKKLSQEEKQRSLKEVITEMEDEVLANAGVDVFEEVFKLIFTKLYDEWMSGRRGQSGKRQLQFFNSGQTETELKTKIQNLFDAAKKKWQGVFKTTEKIALTGSHLSVCVSYLELRKLFNSNLDVVDEAFEYLINQSSKGEKGQYFTPRYVIDLCVKMLNPKENESMIDPAAGSSGFPVHTMFHVWRQIYLDEGEEPSDMFTAEEKLPRCEDYVEEKVFAIDFDEKAVRVARTLNLIAGDGQTNVLHLNTLDYKRWHEWMDDDWQGIYGNGFRRLRHFQAEKDDYKAFLFDIVMANPPFAGDVKESLMISSYELTKDKAGKTKGVGRDILFVERNLDFLKPGGRMAVVLPQGRFNNSSDKYIRDFIAERCRILAVVGLHGNTFKPHTGTKTSVLFVQKWNDDPKAGALCPRQDDYNIFFATMQKSGKDNSGEKIYVKKSDESGEFLLDDHLHLIVDHDLFNHEGKTQDGIAEAFIEFAKKENLSFFKLSPSVKPFDAVKYQQLMDGLEAVEIRWKTVQDKEKIRIDSEHYQKKYKVLVERLNSLNVSIKNLAVLVKQPVLTGHTPSMEKESYYGGKIKFIKTDNLRENFIQDNFDHYLSLEGNKHIQRSSLQENDVIITIIGATYEIIGRACLIEKEILPANINQNIALIRADETKISPFYLNIYLNTHYGRSYLHYLSRQTEQVNLNCREVEEVSVPIFSLYFQKKIENIILLIKQYRNASKQEYDKAEDLLLSELNLKDWQPTEENIAVKSFKESFLSCDRLDAEYYQPKYDEIEKQVKSYSGGWANIRNVLNQDIKNGTTPEGVIQEFIPNKPKFVRIEAFNQSLGIDKESLYSIEDTVLMKYKSIAVFRDDVLVSMTGTIGNVAVYSIDDSAIINQNIVKLTCNKSIIYPYVLALYIKSIGRSLLIRQQTGNVQPYVNIQNFQNLIVPLLFKEVQDRILHFIEKASNQRTKSKQLLEIAKIGVERAIETDEETATIWINQQLEKLGINLKTTT